MFLKKKKLEFLLKGQWVYRIFLLLLSGNVKTQFVSHFFLFVKIEREQFLYSCWIHFVYCSNCLCIWESLDQRNLCKLNILPTFMLFFYLVTLWYQKQFKTIKTLQLSTTLSIPWLFLFCFKRKNINPVRDFFPPSKNKRETHIFQGCKM